MTVHVNGLFIGVLEPNAIVGGCIAIYEKAFPNPYEAIFAVEKQCVDSNSVVKFTKAETFEDGIFQQHRTNYNLGITYCAKSNDAVCQDIHNQVYTTLLSTSSSYVKKFDINDKLYHEDYQMLKYSNNTEYKKHYDGGTGIGRAISALIYLNDDYTGGELEFPNFNVKLKPESGMVVLFPSNYAYAHIAHPVTGGTKYAIVTWIHDRPL